MNLRRSTSGCANLRYPDGLRSGSISPSASRKRILEMVMSGNSPERSPSTSPIVMYARAAEALIRAPLPVAPPAPSQHSWWPPVAPSVGGVLGVAEEDQPELADLDLVAAGQARFVDAFTVDVGAVEASDVTDRELGAAAIE